MNDQTSGKVHASPSNDTVGMIRFGLYNASLNGMRNFEEKKVRENFKQLTRR